MQTHEQKTNEIIKFLRERKNIKPVSFKKKAVSHQVPKVNDKTHNDEKIDLSSLNELISIDVKNMVCVAEPGITFVDLVTETLKFDLVPFTVPELKTITIGGAVSGASLESMSYKYGGFHDSCLEYEIITAKGDVLICTPDNENKLIFQMIHGTFGTLGIITKIKFKLIRAKKFVKINYEEYKDLDSYTKATWKHYIEKDYDFMDGIIHSPNKYILSMGNFVDEAPYSNRYDWMKVYYLSTGKRKEDYLKTINYFFRYEKGVTNVSPKSFLGRLFLGKFLDTTKTLRFVEKFHSIIPEKMIPLTIDLFIPFSRINEFFMWYNQKIKHYPLWYVPYKIVRKYEWINNEILNINPNEELFLDIAIYGMKTDNKEKIYRMIENELFKIGGIKTLISNNYYTEEEFWKTWNKNNYNEVKQKTDPDNIFRDLYTKMCRTTQGLD
jgi:FAD/FMN-containing dehydrogenase